MLQGVAPTTRIELNMKPQEKSPVYGNGFINQHLGQGADLCHNQFKEIFSARPAHCTTTEEGVS